MAESKSTQAKSGESVDAEKQPSPPPDDGNGNGNGESTEDVVAIPVSQLIADGSALLGYPSHAVAGAFSSQPGLAPDDTLDVDTAKTYVETWLQQEVKTDPREGE